MRIVHRVTQQDTVLFDRDCSFCQRSVTAIKAFDWLRLLRFVPLQSTEAQDLKLAESENLSQMVLARAGLHWGGWRAFKRILFRLPLLYVLAAALLFNASIGPGFRMASLGLALLAALALSPIGNPAGDALYRWIARNRHRLPGSTCSIKNR